MIILYLVVNYALALSFLNSHHFEGNRGDWWSCGFLLLCGVPAICAVETYKKCHPAGFEKMRTPRITRLEGAR